MHLKFIQYFHIDKSTLIILLNTQRIPQQKTCNARIWR